MIIVTRPCNVCDPLHPTLRCVSPVGHGGAHDFRVPEPQVVVLR